MVKLVIRDDDLNYFSSVKDVERVYSAISTFPVSFAVIPAVTDVSTIGLCPETRGNKTPMYVGDNKELVEWMKKMQKERGYDICMHGINHTYTFDKRGEKVAEMVWRKDPDLIETISYWKGKMEKDLDCSINCFVAPSNLISKYGIKCVAANKMNFSGIIPITFQRDLTFRNVTNYLKRWYLRFKDRLPYPGILNYGTHKELNACTIQSYEYLVRMYTYCEKNHAPMVINTHYWKLREYPEEREILVKFIKYALNQGALPATLSSLFSE